MVRRDRYCEHVVTITACEGESCERMIKEEGEGEGEGMQDGHLVF